MLWSRCCGAADSFSFVAFVASFPKSFFFFCTHTYTMAFQAYQVSFVYTLPFHSSSDTMGVALIVRKSNISFCPYFQGTTVTTSGPTTTAATGGGGVASFLSTATDDDDISIFVQDIDARKPLSGRVREREKRDRDRQEGGGQVHDRERTDGMVKGKMRAEFEQPRMSPLHTQYITSSPLEEEPVSRTSITTTTTSTTSRTISTTSTSSTARPQASSSSQSPPSSASAAAAAQTSTSPSRGPMLASQDEVDERLRRMNEVFMKSLEGLGGSGRREASAPAREGSSGSSSASASASASASDNSRSEYPTRPTGRGLGLGMHPRSPYQYPHPTYTPSQGLNLGLGRGRHASSTSSQSLSQSQSQGQSEVGMGRGAGSGAGIQGSEEVLGRMDLYEERERRFGGGY
ncbi:hypothetical protein B0H34DRAFT_272467 [Crassisporium funariophilum]|nr:hypothetical protein B0H34DRAFT_272467 [Crassisporium funariophilum]